MNVGWWSAPWDFPRCHAAGWLTGRHGQWRPTGLVVVVSVGDYRRHRVVVQPPPGSQTIGLDCTRGCSTFRVMWDSTRKVMILVGILAVAGCASEARPVLYPNAHLSAVGQAQADADIAECRRMAEAAGASPGSRPGRAGGARRGGRRCDRGRDRRGRRRGPRPSGHRRRGRRRHGRDRRLHALALQRSEPSQAYRGFVDRCLRERGYDPVGWE